MQRNPYSSVVLAAVTADASASSRDMSNFDHIVTYVKGNGTVSAGTLIIEESADAGDTGTWSAIGSSVDLSTLTGNVTLAIHHPVAAYRALRWRLSAAVTGGGSVTVTVGAH